LATEYSPNQDNQLHISGQGMWEYMAPEVVKGEKHEMSVDYYSLGVIANELMFGPNKRPY